MDISSGRSLGIAPKIMFHDVMHKGKKNTLMIKPYHMSAHVDDTESWCPHEYRGWSTMATKSLFDAGGIGHLCEDVSTHVHNNVPVTVHNFDRSALSSGEFHELGKKKPHLTSMFQIGAMDFLTNNLDRHSDNLMVHRDGTPLAIDHERGFQYERTLPDHFEDEGTGFDNIHHYLTRYGPLRKAFNGATVKQGRKAFSELSDWWTKNHIHVKTAMEDQLTAIKDISYRNHIRSNFIARADHLTNVCKKAQANNFDPFTGDDDSDDIRTIPMSERADAGLKSIVEKALPKDNPIMAVNMLADYINGSKALAPKQISTISSVMRDRIAKLTPKQAVELYEHVSENPHFNSPKIKKNREKLDPRFLLLYNIKTKPGSEHAHELSLLAERRLGDHILKNWRRTLVKSLSPKGKG